MTACKPRVDGGQEPGRPGAGPIRPRADGLLASGRAPANAAEGCASPRSRAPGVSGERQAGHVYVDLVLGETAGSADRRYPGVAAHLLACGPCADDYDGLLIAAGGPARDGHA